MQYQLPVVRSARVGVLFLLSVGITAAILIWARYFLPKNGAGLSPIFSLLFADLDAKAAGWSLAILALAAFGSPKVLRDQLLEWISRYMSYLAAATFVLLCIGSLAIYRNHPLAMDEYAQYLQSQIFAAGRLSGSFPLALMDWLVPPGFQNYFITVSKSTGAVASGYWPSFALLLTPFTALGIPWACNPLISALTLLAVNKLAFKLYADRDAAAFAVLLTLASPEFAVNGITYYSMPAHLLANTVYAVLLLEPTRAKALLAGIIGSIALTLHNPVPHILFAMPWVLWIAGRSDGGKLILCLATGYAPFCLLLGFGWFWLTGHFRHEGAAAPIRPSDLANMWQSLSVFSLPNASVLLARMIGIAKTWLWAVPGMIILAGAGAWKGWSHRPIRVLTWSALVTLFGYFIVPVDQGHGWGYRYFHTAWIVLPVLAAGALTQTGIGRSANTFENEACRDFVISCAVLMLIVGVSVRAVQVRGFITSDLAQLPTYASLQRCVVFIDASSTFYGADLVQNDPWLRAPVIRMISHGSEQDARMMAQNFPDLRLVYEDRHGSVWSKAL